MARVVPICASISSAPVRVSVVIPTRNEAANLRVLLPQLQRLRDAERLLENVVVSDFNSQDETQAVASGHAACVVTGASGRGPQLNAGAQAATGNVFWFLHADARPHAHALRAIERGAFHDCVGGNFRLRFAARGNWPRLFEMIAFAQRNCGVAYGDSGFWVRSDTFTQMGGFAAWPLFEDYEFWRRLHAVGRVDASRLPLWVSARRFERAPARTLGLWLQMQVLFWRGVAPEELARIYHRET